MENSRPKEEKITKDIGNLFKWEKETKAFKDRRLGCIKKLFEHEQKEKNYYKPVKIKNVWSNNYIESFCDSKKTLSVEEYIRPYLKDIVNNL